MYEEGVIKKLTFSKDWRTSFVIVELKQNALREGAYYEEFQQLIKEKEIDSMDEAKYLVRVLSLGSIQAELAEVKKKHSTMEDIEFEIEDKYKNGN